MGYYHFSLKNSSTNNTPASAHYDYIMREGRHSNKGDVHEFVASEAFNIPNWAETPREFFEAADKHERKNGIVYQELEIGLPNQLPLEENVKIVHQVIDECVGTDKAVAYAIHKKYSKVNAALGIESLNIHAHIMFSDRSITDNKDNIKPAESFFKRYNQVNQAKGGYKKDRRFAGNRKQSSAFITKCRQFLADKINEKFRENNINDSVTHLSIKDQKLIAKASNDLEKLQELNKREKTRISYREYKKLEKILLSKCSLDEKISRITDLDVKEIIEGKQKKGSQGKYTGRFRQKMLCLADITKKIKKLEKANPEQVMDDNHTRYLTEIVAKIGQRLFDAKNYKVNKISKIEQSKYYNNKYLNALAINVVTKGLYMKYLKILSEIKKQQDNGKDSSNLLKTAAGYNKQINELITPANKEKTKEIYTRYKDKKQEFTKAASQWKREVIQVSEVLSKFAKVSTELKKEKDIKAINGLLPQNELRDIDKITDANIKKGDKGFNQEHLQNIIDKSIGFVEKIETELIKRKKYLEEKERETQKTKRSDDYSR